MHHHYQLKIFWACYSSVHYTFWLGSAVQRWQGLEGSIQHKLVLLLMSVAGLTSLFPWEGMLLEEPKGISRRTKVYLSRKSVPGKMEYYVFYPCAHKLFSYGLIIILCSMQLIKVANSYFAYTSHWMWRDWVGQSIRNKVRRTGRERFARLAWTLLVSIHY